MIFKRLFFVAVLLMQGKAFAELPLIEQYTPISVPAFEMHDLNGKVSNIESFEGNVVLIHFWATWCANCTKEMKVLDQLQKTLRKDPIIIAPISEDFKGVEVVREFYRNHKLNHLLSYVDNKNEAFELLGATNLPTSYIIDTEGKNVAKITGVVDWASEDMIHLLKSYIRPRESANADYMNLLKEQASGATQTDKPIQEEIPEAAITEISPVELEGITANDNNSENHFTNVQEDKFSLTVKRPVNPKKINE